MAMACYGDGVLDVLVGGAHSSSPSGQLDVFLGRRGDFPVPTPVVTEIVQAYSGVARIETGDFNRDGHADLALIVVGQLLLMRGNGDGTFAEPESQQVIGRVASETVCDLNGDGADDLVMSGDDGYSTVGASVLFNRKPAP
jgi:hypothetical protein